MIVVDTSVWIEFFKGNAPIFPKLKELVEMRQVIACECVFGELLQGARTKRERSILNEYWENLPKVDEHNIWIEAGTFSSEKKIQSKGVGLID
ncbi:MAG: PIN domain-containing protein, partial [bacterium]